MGAFFLKLTALVILAAALVAHQWWSLEQEFQAAGPLSGTLEPLGKIVKLLQEVPAPKIVVAGDSKAERHIIPELFANAGLPAVNVAAPTVDLWLLVRTLQSLNVHQLNAVFLISVGAYQINDGYLERDSITPEAFFSYTPWERLSAFQADYFRVARFMSDRLPAFRQFPELIQTVAASPAFYANLGFLPIEPAEFSCVRIRHSSRVSTHPPYRNIQPDGARWRLYKEALRELSTWPGRFVLFNFPLSQKGRGCVQGTYADEFEREFAKRTSDEVARFGNVRFLNLYDNGKFAVSDDYYYDPGHLNKHGAALFTDWWLKYLKEEKIVPGP